MPETFTDMEHPLDPTYQIKRRKMINELLQMNVSQLNMQLQYQKQQRPPRDETGEMTKHIMRDLLNAPFVPDSIKANILDSTTSTGTATTGGYLIRQDLEPVWAF